LLPAWVSNKAASSVVIRGPLGSRPGLPDNHIEDPAIAAYRRREMSNALSPGLGDAIRWPS